VYDNNNRKRVFLETVLSGEDYKSHDLWKNHQKMQHEYVMAQGLTPQHTFLDIGCGPLRLGSRIIPFLTGGHYFGTDINSETLDLGRSIAAEEGVDMSNATLIATDAFDFSEVNKDVDMAFSNSVFSHLTLNTIGICLANLSQILAPGVRYFTTFFLAEDVDVWRKPKPQNKWGREFYTYPAKDPYHYTAEMFANLAEECGFDFEIDESYGHPTQTMAVLTRL